MYILSWNPDSRTLEACFGGVVTPGECEVFVDELRERLLGLQGSQFSVTIDLATCKSNENHVQEGLVAARDACHFAGSAGLTIIARDEDAVAEFTNQRLQQVLEGSERYVAYGLAA